MLSKVEYDQAAELSIPEMHLVKHSWVLGSKDLASLIYIVFCLV